MGGHYRSGSCLGTKNGYKCHTCSNSKCPKGQYRSGSCSHTTNGYKCNKCKKKKCRKGQYLQSCSSYSDSSCKTCYQIQDCAVTSTCSNPRTRHCAKCISGSKLVKKQGFGGSDICVRITDGTWTEWSYPLDSHGQRIRGATMTRKCVGRAHGGRGCPGSSNKKRGNEGACRSDDDCISRKCRSYSPGWAACVD